MKPDPSVSPNDIRWNEVGMTAELKDANILVRPETSWPAHWQWEVRMHKSICIWGARCKTAKEAQELALKAYRLLQQNFL